MKMAFIGLPGCGKSTTFACVTGDRHCFENYSIDEPYLDAVPIPDERTEFLRELIQPKKVTNIHIDLLDYHGLFAGGPGGKGQQSSKDSKLLATVREVDGLVVVLKGFGEDADAPPSLVADFDNVRTELLLGDMGQVERRIKKLRNQVNKPTESQEADRAELTVLERCAEILDEGKPISDVDMSDRERKLLRGFRFLTEKPVLALVNVGEDYTVPDEVMEELRRRSQRVEVVNSEIELEIAELDEADQAEFMADYGVTEPAAGRILQACFDLLEMITFITIGEKDVHAWELPAGSTAIEAADKVHTDMARGFIRAEVIAFDDLKEAGSVKAARAANKEHVVGKEHVVKDGDIIRIRFSPA